MGVSGAHAQGDLLLKENLDDDPLDAIGASISVDMAVAPSSFSAGLRLEAPVAVPMGPGSANGSRRLHSSTIDVGGDDMMKGTQTTIEITPPTTASTMAPQDNYAGCSRPHSRGICLTPSSAANDT